MKTLNALLFVGFALSGLGTQAAPLSAPMEGLVIDKLDRALSVMDRKSPSWGPAHLRLADLLAQRARQRFMAEVEAGCKGCKGSVKDRDRATDMYEEALKSGGVVDGGAVLLQLAHLRSMAGETAEAKKLFVRMVDAKKGTYKPEQVTQARTALGDLAFQDGDVKSARAHYETALKDQDLPNRGVIKYRVAWCKFQSGRLDEATRDLERLLSSEDLAGDKPLRGDVLRDLAAFYGRRPVTPARIAKYRDLAPADERKQFLLHFATETDRVGQKEAADSILQAYLSEPGLTNGEKMDALIRRAQIKYDKGDATSSTSEFAVAAMNLKQEGCKDAESCADLQKRMKKYVTDLHRSQKNKPTRDVLKAYFIYVKTFPEDAEMAILGAQVATEMELYPLAMTMYRSAQVASVSAKNEKMLSTSVWGEIEVAELAKEINAREAAYNQALVVVPKDPKAFYIRYQLAHIAYERKQWLKAAQMFRALALDATGAPDLRRKAADLTMDALAVEKRDADIELVAREFSAAFPERASEFAGLSRKATLNQAANTINADGSSDGQLRDALGKLKATDLAKASSSEKIIHLKNRSVVAQRLHDDAELRVALAALLAQSALSASDREDALARLVGSYETRLEFDSAYATALKMKFPKLSTSEREHRLGTLADLAGREPRAHYERALKAGLKGDRAVAVRLRLVQLSRSPVAELSKQKKGLSSSKKTYAEAVLFVFAKTGDAKAVQSHLGALKATPVPTFVRKQEFFARAQAMSKKIAAHQLDARRDSVLQKSIQARGRLLKTADGLLSEAVRSGDFTSQVLALSTVAAENNRFVGDLLALPVPAQLDAKEKIQYAHLLKETSRPYAVKARIAQEKLREFWSNRHALSSLVRDAQTAMPDVRPLVRNELRLLAGVAPDSLRSQLEAAAAQKGPDLSELQSARENVRRNPGDARELEKLKDLETKLGHPLMSSYLEARLERIQRQEI